MAGPLKNENEGATKRLVMIDWRGPGLGLGGTVLLLSAIAHFSASDLAAQTRIGIERGAQPEPLVLETIDGERVDLGESFGRRPVVLQFWATWCPKCEALEPQMIAAHEEFGDQVDFFGVAVAVGQNPRRIRSHLEDRPLPFPMLWDARGAATRRFMAPTTSYIVILDAEGRVTYTGVDVGQDIRGALVAAIGDEETPVSP